MPSKRLLLTVHRWCGLAACLWVLVQALTGSALLFRQELARSLDPDGMVRHTVSGEAPLSAVLQSLRSRYPGYEIQRVVWPQQKDDVYFAHMVDAQGDVVFASVDPGDARILRAGGLWSFPTEALLAIHFRLVTGKAGLALVLLGALSILTLAASGWVYWLPRKGRVLKGLQIGWSLPGRLLLRQLHRTTGLAVSLIAAVSIVTGVLVGSEYMIEPGPLTSTSPSPGGPGPLAGVDEALSAARALHPTQGMRDVRMPKAGVFKAFFWAPDRSALAVDTVQASLPEGHVTAVRPAREDRSLWVTFLPIHTGEAFGLTGRLILLFGGLGLVALAVTGPLMWAQKRS